MGKYEVNPPSDTTDLGITDREFFSYKENLTDSGVDKRVCDIAAQAILNLILAELGGTPGTPVFDDAFNVASPGSGSTVNLISTSVAALKTRTFVNFSCSSRVGGRFELKLDGSIISVIETGAGHYNGQNLFSSLRKGAAGAIITVDFIQVQGKSGAPVSAQLTTTEI